MIALIARHESAHLLRNLQTWLMAALLAVLFGYLFLQQLEIFVGVQDKLALQDHPVGLTGFLTVRYLEPLALAMTLVAPLFAMRSFSDEFRQHTYVLWQASPVSIGALVIGKFLGLMLVVGALVLLAVALILPMQLFVPLDIPVLASSAIGLLLLSAAAVATGLYFSSLTQHAIIAIVCSLSLLLILWLVGSSTPASTSLSALSALSIPTHLHGFFQGYISTADIAYFGLFTALFLLLTGIRLDALRYTGR